MKTSRLFLISSLSAALFAQHVVYAEAEQHSTIPAATAAKAGILTEQGSRGQIRQQQTLFGTIQPVPEQHYRISAAYPGVVQQIHVRVGDKVSQGQLLATVQNAATLQNYSIRASAAGEVTARLLNAGERVADLPLLEIIDFSSVYAELDAFPASLRQLSHGNTVSLSDLDQQQHTSGKLSYIAPQQGEGYSTRIRVLLDNKEGLWRPGMPVKATIDTVTTEASLLIRKSALQTLNEQTVVFVRQQDQFSARAISLGLQDSQYAEVLSGLEPHEDYVWQNSFVIKSELLKGTAEH